MPAPMAGTCRKGRLTGRNSATKLHAELDRLEGIYRKLLDGSGVEIIDARAKVKDAHTV